jgi:hypothetical protein
MTMARFLSVVETLDLGNWIAPPPPSKKEL